MTRAALLSGPLRLLILLLANLLPVPFASQRLLYALFLAWFQVERMPLYFLDDVFRLYLAFEAAEGIFQWFTLLHSNFRQYLHPQTFPVWMSSYCSLPSASQAHSERNTHSFSSIASCLESVCAGFCRLLLRAIPCAFRFLEQSAITYYI